MDKQFALKIQLEIIWWLVTAVIAFLVVRPMLDKFVDYEFLYSNVLFVVVFITYARYIFLLKFTFLSHVRIVKLLLIFASIPLVFHLVNEISAFQNFLDNEGLVSFNRYFEPGITFEERKSLLTYLRQEMIFFGVASVIAAVIMPFRMLVSIWRVYNKKGTV